MTKLTPRQWATYRFIKNRSEDGRRATISDLIANYPYSEEMEDGYKASSNPNAHDKCKAVWQDIETLNKSSEIEKIIIIDNFTYRLSNKEESEAYAKKLYDKAVKAMARYARIRRKMNKDGQGKLISCQGNEIDEDSEARAFVEAFVGR